MVFLYSYCNYTYWMFMCELNFWQVRTTWTEQTNDEYFLCILWENNIYFNLLTSIFWYIFIMYKKYNEYNQLYKLVVAVMYNMSQRPLRCGLQRIPGGASLAVNVSVCGCLSETQLVIKFSNHLSELLDLFPPRWTPKDILSHYDNTYCSDFSLHPHTVWTRLL